MVPSNTKSAAKRAAIRVVGSGLAVPVQSSIAAAIVYDAAAVTGPFDVLSSWSRKALQLFCSSPQLRPIVLVPYLFKTYPINEDVTIIMKSLVVQLIIYRLKKNVEVQIIDITRTLYVVLHQIIIADLYYS